MRRWRWLLAVLVFALMMPLPRTPDAPMVSSRDTLAECRGQCAVERVDDARSWAATLHSGQTCWRAVVWHTCFAPGVSLVSSQATQWRELQTQYLWPLTESIPMRPGGIDLDPEGPNDQDAQAVAERLRSGGISADRLVVTHAPAEAHPLHVDSDGGRVLGVYLVPRLRVRWVDETYEILPARDDAFRSARWRLEVELTGYSCIGISKPGDYPPPDRLPTLATLL